jgi:hypothetical protein
MAGLLVSTATCYAQSSSDTPSLNDLAKRSKSGRKPVLVITDENLPIAPSNQPITQTGNGPGTAAASGTSVGNTAPASAQAAQKQDKKDSAAPTTTDQRTSEMKQKLASYQKEQDGWKSSVKRYEDLLATETNDFRRQMYEDALENDKHNVALYQDKIDQVQSDLSKAQQASHQGGSGQSDSSTAPSGGSQL